MTELDSLVNFEPDHLLSQLTALQDYFLSFAKLTNNGRGPSELRTEKLKILKRWLEEYSDKEKFLLQTIPQRYKNKPVAVDGSTLDKYQEYAEIALTYMLELPGKYQIIKNKTLPLLAIRKQIVKNLNVFELEEEDLWKMVSANNETEETIIQGITHTPQKTINTIRSLLRSYGRFITTVEEQHQKILPLLHSLENLTLEKTYNQFNRRNKLLQSLVKNLSNIKKTIEQNDFTHKLAIIKEYQSILQEINHYLPLEVIKKLSLTSITSPLEEEINRSIGKSKKYDPLKDPEMGWPKSTISVDEPKFKEKIDNRIDRVLKHQELADISQREGNPLSPEEKQKYEQLWKNQAESIPKKIIRIANYLEIKYL